MWFKMFACLCVIYCVMVYGVSLSLGGCLCVIDCVTLSTCVVMCVMCVYVFVCM